MITSSAPPISRTFLPWHEPALPAVVALLADAYAAGDEIRMGAATIVLPGARTGRRLKELLLEEADRRGLRLIPPAVTTVGALPEALYESPLPAAEPALSRRLWVNAMREMPRERLSLVFPTAPPAGDLLGWHRLASTAQRLHTTVGAAAKTFRGVMQCCDEGLLFSDIERWTVLAEAQDLYASAVRQLGRADRELARIAALDADRVTRSGDLWLVGISEMPLVLRRMLLAARGDFTLRVLVHAEDGAAAAFDDLGCVIPDEWLEREIPLRESQIAIRGRPGDQATEAVRALADVAAEYAADDVVVAVPDDEVLPHLEQHFLEAEVPVRNAAGRPLEASAPYRMLAAMAEYLGEDTFQAGSALARHPDLWHWLERAGGFREKDAWLEPLDGYFSEHLPANLSTRAGTSAGRSAKEVDALCRALEDPRLLGRMRGKRTLADWAPAIMELLLEIYGSNRLNRARPRDRRLLEACKKLRDTAAELYRLPNEADEACDAATAIRLLLEEARGGAIPPESDRAAVELLGWLELHMDDSPVAIVTGFNEPFLPESLNADAFLPNALRTRLGLVDNDGRYARDAYQLTAILHSHEQVRVIAGRRTAKGDPLRPSRLMFAVSGRDLAERVRRFYSEGTEGAAPADVQAIPEASTVAAVTRFRLPPEPQLSAPEVADRISVTAFRKLLEDPYGYALERILRLRTMDDAAQEMDGLLFGKLAHAVLERFGRSPEVHSTDAHTIRGQLDSLLDEVAAERFPSAPLPAVRIQIEQMRARLGAFAHWHAGWIGEGWRVVGVECTTPDAGVAFDVDGVPIAIHGRIDRIDYHPDLDTYAVFDYKTGDRAQLPEETHRRGRAGERVWTDLQLPLYRHLLPVVEDRDGTSPVEAGRGAEVELGYILLPRELDRSGHSFGDWSEDELEEANERAREAVRFLRTNVFAFETGAGGKYLDERVAALLGMGHLASALDDDDEVEE